LGLGSFEVAAHGTAEPRKVGTRAFGD